MLEVAVLVCSTLASAAVLSFLFFRILSSSPSSPRTKSVALVVLGDIGRSPRMLYHVQSFARHGYETSILAYRGSAPPKELTENEKVEFVYLATHFSWIGGLAKPLFLALLPLKVLAGAWGLLWALLVLPAPPAYLFVQNPPAIPTLAIVKLAALLRGSRVIIDWHNTGYSVLALRLGPTHPVVRFARFLELLFGRTAYAHLCVSDAMKTQLAEEAKLNGNLVTLHDRPPASFRRQTPEEAHELFSRLPELSTLATSFLPALPLAPDTTLFSSASSGLLPSRPALLVSATSWTADEDFSILLSALELYERAARTSSSGAGGLKDPQNSAPQRLPRVVVLITGKGAGKKAFEQDVQRREKGWEWVRVRTAWLAREDYPKLLGSADVGISLHTSTSGIDLPMKVVDMFGCGLPALALDFPCVGELVKDGQNGRTFNTAEDLADQLITLLRGFPHTGASELDRLRQGIAQARYRGEPGRLWGNWDETWDEVVMPLLEAQ
ncbi:chitobiosyldiphosphodolichol beta-1,4 mannosyltransferase [Rhodotorula paludigena]|uniref:chitobiosyldiphosphodolichol beta-1,4 mannosyltransferase n=1 Tax=Rhodotorula paludigena TaxID=86838 RepID=UPI00316ED715